MLADVIDSLGSNSFTLQHRAPGGFDGHGRVLAPVTSSATTTTGMLQPHDGRQVERLKEGLHAKELRYYFSPDVLVIADHDAGTIGDHLVADGAQWEVVGGEDWTSVSDFAGFFQYTLSRVDP